MKKNIIVVISVLCIITSITSNMNFIITKASDDEHIVEIILQVFGVEGFRDTKVQFTGQQYRNLRHYLITIQTRLNQTTTREEAFALFREAIAELEMYGLLPKGMTFDQVFSIVSGERFRLMTQNFLKTKHAIHYSNSNTTSHVINKFCFFYAHTWCAFEDNIWIIPAFLFDILFYMFNLKIFYVLGSLLFDYGQTKPFRFMNRIWLAGPGIGGYTYDYYTVGLLGIRKGGDDFGTAYGFSGIKLILDDQLEAVYFGFTLLATK